MNQKDEAAFETFIREHHPVISKVCRIYTDTALDFEDYYQEVALQLWRSHQSFRNEAKLSTWVYRVALNVCLSLFKKQKRKPHTQQLAPSHLLQSVETEEKDERLELLYRSIRQLKEIDRAVILLYLEEKSYKEIAEALGMSVSNVGARVNRIKNKLIKMVHGK